MEGFESLSDLTERNLNVVYDKGFRTEIVAGDSFYDVPTGGGR